MELNATVIGQVLAVMLWLIPAAYFAMTKSAFNYRMGWVIAAVFFGPFALIVFLITRRWFTPLAA